jgi:hypothetical protein
MFGRQQLTRGNCCFPPLSLALSPKGEREFCPLPTRLRAAKPTPNSLFTVLVTRPARPTPNSLVIVLVPRQAGNLPHNTLANPSASKEAAAAHVIADTAGSLKSVPLSTAWKKIRANAR